MLLCRDQAFTGICLSVTYGWLSLVGHMVQLGSGVILELPREKLHESYTF